MRESRFFRCEFYAVSVQITATCATDMGGLNDGLGQITSKLNLTRQREEPFLLLPLKN